MRIRLSSPSVRNTQEASRLLLPDTEPDNQRTRQPETTASLGGQQTTADNSLVGGTTAAGIRGGFGGVGGVKVYYNGNLL